MFLNKIVVIGFHLLLSIHKGPINNTPTLVQMIACRFTHTCVTRPRWDNDYFFQYLVVSINVDKLKQFYSYCILMCVYHIIVSPKFPFYLQCRESILKYWTPLQLKHCFKLGRLRETPKWCQHVDYRTHLFWPSHRKISWNLEVARFDVMMIVLL